MKQLLKKYIDGNISPEEFDRLSSMVSACSDVELARLLDEDWRHFSTAFLPAGRKGRSHTFFKSGIAVWTSVAAGLLFFISVGLGLMLTDSEKEKAYLASREVTMSAGETGQSSVMLPDGTKVILNARSSITYPTDFGLESRTVKISGQGFFDVFAARYDSCIDHSRTDSYSSMLLSQSLSVFGQTCDRIPYISNIPPSPPRKIATVEQQWPLQARPHPDQMLYP